MASRRLILFTRYPVPGLAKTRLIPALGAEGAADLSRQMTEHVLDRLRPLADEGIEIQVWHEGGSAGEMAAWLGPGRCFIPQGDGDLGARMERAFRESFAGGVERVVVVGSDCPDLGPGDIREAFELLDDNPMVLGPALDGGYYLIAVRANAPGSLFAGAFLGIPWGTPQVYSATMNAMAEAGVDVGLLDEKADVDGPEDLVHWKEETGVRRQESGEVESRAQGGASLSISVVIPTLNEEDTIGGLLDDLKDEGVEVVVADGGSADGTVAACEAAGVRIIPSLPGRGRQLNAGAAAATGDVLLFLHADSRLPRGFAGHVCRALEDRDVAGGAFSLSFDRDTAAMRLIADVATWRAWRLGIVFGDQAVFCRREIFRRIGGFPDMPIMEDAELVRRLKGAGRFEVLDEMVVTSARRWERGGILRTTLVNQLITWLWMAGMRPEKLAKMHRMLTREKERRTP